MSYIGQTPTGLYTTTNAKDTFSGNGAATSFTLSQAGTTNNVDVFVENVRQEPTVAYTVDGTTLTFTAAPVAGTDNIYVVNRGPAELSASHPASQALEAYSGTFTTDLMVNGAFTSQGIDDNASSTAVTIDGSGNVGVGTSPSAPLHVKSSTGNSKVIFEHTSPSTGTGQTSTFVDGSSNTTVIYDNTGSYIIGTSSNPVTGAAFSEAARFNSSGNLAFPNGQGIDFSASAGGNATSSILDDYEEGTWSPIIYDQNIYGHQLTISGVVGRYTKIGRWVNCTLMVNRADATSLTNIIVFTNLPYTTGPTSSVTGGTFWLDKTSSDRIGIIYVVPSTDRFYLVPTHATDDYLLMSEWQNGRPIYLQISFEAA